VISIDIATICANSIRRLIENVPGVKIPN